MLLIGCSKKVLKGTSLVEVMVAMVIVMVCFGLLIVFGGRVINSRRIEDQLKAQYVKRKECIEVFVDPDRGLSFSPQQGFSAVRLIDAQKQDSLVLQIEVYKGTLHVSSSKYYIYK